jgi:hypothetical protein
MWKELNSISGGTDDNRKKWMTHLNRMGNVRFPKRAICHERKARRGMGSHPKDDYEL